MVFIIDAAICDQAAAVWVNWPGSWANLAT